MPHVAVSKQQRAYLQLNIHDIERLVALASEAVAAADEAHHALLLLDERPRKRMGHCE